MTILAVEGWIYCEDHGGHWADLVETICPSCRVLSTRPVSQVLQGGAFECARCGAREIGDPSVLLAIPLPPPFERVVESARRVVDMVQQASQVTGVDLTFGPFGMALTELGFSLTLARKADAP